MVAKDARIQVNSNSGQEGGRNKDQGRGRSESGGLNEEKLEQKDCTARWETVLHRKVALCIREGFPGQVRGFGFILEIWLPKEERWKQ